jgi:exodeoxyribonuclease VII large subunit
VVRAIAASDIPVISAVGHEIDWALSDFAADLRAPTPSAAAELVSESRAVIEAELAHLRGEFETAMRSRLERSRLLLGRFEPASVEARFLKVLAPSIRRHDEAKDGLIRGMDDRIAESGRRLELARASLEAASPQAVLERGFAVVRDKDGKAVRDAGAVAPGGLLDIQFAKGRAVARAEKVEI